MERHLNESQNIIGENVERSIAKKKWFNNSPETSLGLVRESII